MSATNIGQNSVALASKWIKTDETQDVAGSIRHALRGFDTVDFDPQAWKWIFLALHSALQGACVCHLVKTASPLGVVKEKNEKEWYKYFDSLNSDSPIMQPKTDLMALPELIKAVRKPNSSGGLSGEQISITHSELAWLTRLHTEFRNQFVHFSPIGWTIEISGIPNFARLTASIITQILDHGWAFRHMNVDEREQLAKNLKILASLNHA